ncbi:MAG TPA: hypothetical protein VL921_22670 [Candidatus Udaeobacter sp.]|nr:hypothetical protein [Candidatus Udaeobacter sp.]
MSDEQAQQRGASRASKETAAAAGAKFKANSQKALAFALMLTVPVALSGCNTANSTDCTDYDNNGYCDNNSGSSRGTYISNGQTYKKSSSYKSGSSSSKGFGSSGISSGSSGG